MQPDDAASEDSTKIQVHNQGEQNRLGSHRLPPRVVVELPDGEVRIGEDSTRLQHEQREVDRQRPSQRTGAQPGTEQWLELRRLLYATSLEAVSLKRKRFTILLVGAHPASNAPVGPKAPRSARAALYQLPESAHCMQRSI
jgi:hypothetical protein